MSKRLELPTLRVNLKRSLTLRFRGKKYRGFEGDTVATALCANGVRLLARSDRLRRPRGLYSLDGDAGATILRVNGVLAPAESTPLVKGTKVKPVNVRFGLEKDPFAFFDRFDWLRPVRFGHRAAASSDEPSGDDPEVRYINADVCVIGGGPAGIRAATTVAGYGLRVVILERLPWFGGHFDWLDAPYNKEKALYQRGRELAGRLWELSGIRRFTGTEAVAINAHRQVIAFQREWERKAVRPRRLEISAPNLIVATGAAERPLLFAHNDRPGVMAVETALRLVHTYGVLPGQQAVLSVGHDDGLAAAVALSDAGLDVSAVGDCRTQPTDGTLAEKLRRRNIEYLPGWTASEAVGELQVETAIFRTLDGKFRKTFECDLIAASAGPWPRLKLMVQAGAALTFDGRSGIYLAASPPAANLFAAGRVLGRYQPFAVEMSGRLAGLKAAAALGQPVEDALVAAEETFRGLPALPKGHGFVRASGDARRFFVCREGDITVRDIETAVGKGEPEAAIAGYFAGACRNASIANLPFVLSSIGGGTMDDLGARALTDALHDAGLSDGAGHRPDMPRRSPVHEVLAGYSGVVFERRNGWERPLRFGEEASEVAAPANGAGISDASALTRLRLFGPGAENALKSLLFYRHERLTQGTAAEWFLCDLRGRAVDRGMVVQSGPRDFFLTAAHLSFDEIAAQFHQYAGEAAGKFYLVDLTEVLGAVRLFGVNARDILQRQTDGNLSTQAFPPMAYRRFLIRRQVEAHAIQTGELAELCYEIYVTASRMADFWRLLAETGAASGLRPCGLAAESVLRLERGTVDLSLESDPNATLRDAGLWRREHRSFGDIRPKGYDAVFSDAERPDRRVRVGFVVAENEAGVSRIPPEGAIIMCGAAECGRVCISRFSPALDRVVGTAFVIPELAEPESRLSIYEDIHSRVPISATVAGLPFVG